MARRKLKLEAPPETPQTSATRRVASLSERLGDKALSNKLCATKTTPAQQQAPVAAAPPQTQTETQTETR